jgi:SPP1 gp7 family putative phage head morphogenesis protein
MPVNLSNAAREAYLRQQIDQLRVIYRDAQKNLADKLRLIDLTDFQRYRAEKLLAEVNQIVAGLDRRTYVWAKKSIPFSYERGIDIAADRLKAMNVTRFVSYDAQIHTSAVNIMVDDVTLEFMASNQSIKTSFNRVIRQTQQRLIEDREISRSIAQGIVQGETRRAVSDSILKNLREQLGNEQFITIKGRHYRPDKYAELVARTRTREATSQGTINTALRYGVDLVQWDAHSEVCEYCQQFSGRVYSISGQDEDFPMLTEKPPLHPNCKCVIMPVTKGHLERRGELNETVKLSNSPSTKIDSFSRFEEVMAGL